MADKKRILFFGEPATLAHVARPVVLASSLDPERFEVAIATGGDFRRVAENAGLRVLDLRSIGTRAYLAAVSKGHVVFPYQVLEDYVRDDLRHIEAFRPDLIVGDFRLSLAVSARLARIPYFAVVNAYWSPCSDARMEIPVHPATALLGPTIANSIFSVISPAVLAMHSLPMLRLRKNYGMSSLGFDLRRVFSEGDVTLFPDVPEMVPTRNCGTAGRYRYIGPVVWSPAGDVPDDIKRHVDSRPLVYVSIGSSGDPGLLGIIVQALAPLECAVVVATAGHRLEGPLPQNTLTANYLPGNLLAKMANVVVCNGGSPSTHQALEQGRPVLGIPANLDQLLNMQFVTRAQAGVSIRQDLVSHEAVRSAVIRLLGETALTENAAKVAAWFQGRKATAMFRAAVSSLW
jgi:UDP:flavonoid glycosyltransferase YjiC (YdhE family)